MGLWNVCRLKDWVRQSSQAWHNQSNVRKSSSICVLSSIEFDCLRLSLAIELLHLYSIKLQIIGRIIFLLYILYVPFFVTDVRYTSGFASA